MGLMPAAILLDRPASCEGRTQMDTEPAMVTPILDRQSELKAASR